MNKPSPGKVGIKQSPMQKRDVRQDGAEKDVLISQLKAQVFELEQNERNFNGLNQKFRNLQNEFALINDEKLRLEYDFKQRLDTANKQYSDMRSDYENIQQSYNEKQLLNKKLYGELNNLEKVIEDKNDEITNLSRQIDQFYENNVLLSDEKLSLEKKVFDLTDSNHKHTSHIERIQSENDHQRKVISDQDFTIKNLENDRAKLNSKVDDLNNTIRNLQNKINQLDGELGHSQRINEDSKKTIQKYQSNIKDFENQCERYSHEINTLTNLNNKEVRERTDCENKNIQLERMLKDKTNELNNRNYELENSNIKNDKLLEDNNKLFNEIEKLKAHIMVLTEQNHNYTNEMANVIDQNERIKNSLMNGNEKLHSLISNNKLKLESSINRLDQRGYSPNINTRGMSPRFSPNRSKMNDI